MREIDRELKSTIKKIINKRLKETTYSTKEDLLGLLLDSEGVRSQKPCFKNLGPYRNLVTRPPLRTCAAAHWFYKENLERKQ
ncbi:hypothetical protein Hanom_Chr12g01121541 [Helianthus anomalus]